MIGRVAAMRVVASVAMLFSALGMAWAEADLSLPGLSGEVGVIAKEHRKVRDEKAALQKRLQEKEQRVNALEVELKKLQTIPGPEMVRISGGCFKMGQTAQEK